MKRRFQAVKGTRDILPPESALWNHVEQTARRVLGAYNFEEIRLPLFEDYEVFGRSVGAETDIVSKEMYTFEDRAYEFQAPSDTEGLTSFVEEVEKGIKSGAIPNTKDNQVILNMLRRYAEEEEELVSRLFKREQSKEFFDEWKGHFRDMDRCLLMARDLQLGDRISLRPEATASVCRAYIEHGLHTRPGNVKLYYIGPMFRRERPQKGRYRQFYQIGAEVLGSDHPAIDAEIIEMVLAFIEGCGLPAPSGAEGKGCALYVNSIGCSDCRPKYIQVLKKELKKVKAKLGPDSQRRIETNPLRVLDSKVEGEQAVIEKLPSILDHLCEACRQHFQQFQQELKDRGIAYEINWRLVRGLDYYVRTTFEITAPGLGAQNAICGGGRYDGLIELLGGPPTKGTGWALGTDRFLLALEQARVGADQQPLQVFVVWLGSAAYSAARELTQRLRAAGVRVELAYEEMKLKKALGRADQLGARHALIIGENELAQGKFTLRELETGTQRALTQDDLLRELSGAGRGLSRDNL
jgi:histidyl-tRNA synthetase